MKWPTYKIKNWGDFVRRVDRFVTPRRGETNRFIFRGQADSEWQLEPSLARDLKRYKIPKDNAPALEQKARAEFAKQAHLRFSSLPLPDEKDFLKWWELMQHYNAPTRLLDWTKSAYVAAYFAVVAQPERDGAVWAVEPGAVMDRVIEKHPTSVARFELYPSR